MCLTFPFHPVKRSDCQFVVWAFSNIAHRSVPVTFVPRYVADLVALTVLAASTIDHVVLYSIHVIAICRRLAAREENKLSLSKQRLGGDQITMT